MNCFYILSKIFSLKRKGLSDARVPITKLKSKKMITKKENGFAVHLL